jgi:TPR repeat protein
MAFKLPYFLSANMFNRILFSCLFCFTLSLLVGCSNTEKPNAVADNADVEAAKKDFREITDYATRLQAEQGNPENGLKFFDMRRAENFEVWKKVAEKGVPEGQMLLAMCYGAGVGVPQDKAMGANLTRKAAEQGLAEAQCHLGMAYSEGFGVPQDKEEAVKWLRKASEQEHEMATFLLQRMNEEPFDAPQDIGAPKPMVEKSISEKPFIVKNLRGDTTEKFTVRIDVVVHKADNYKFDILHDERKAQIVDCITSILQATTTEERMEAGLMVFKEKVKRGINDVLGTPYVQQVLCSGVELDVQ